MDCDLLIIGSGFGGSVCAMRAAKAGLKVIVLERGRRYTEQSFEEMSRGDLPIIDRRDSPGLVSMHARGGLAAMTGCAVGGGSHVYTAVTVPAPREVFENDWPRDVTYERLQPHFRLAQEIIGPSVSTQELDRSRLLSGMAGKLGAMAVPLPMAMNWSPRDLQAAPPSMEPKRWAVEKLRGGPICRKRTLDQTYLREAEAAGAEIRPLHEMLDIFPQGEGYRARFRRFASGEWTNGDLRCRRVVLSAGTLNTVRLLLKWRNMDGTLPRLSRALGERFFTNGDLGAILLYPVQDIALDSGPMVSGWIDLWAKHRMYLMDLGLLPRGAWPVNWMRPVKAQKYCWNFGVFGFDTDASRLVLDRSELRRVAPQQSGLFLQTALSRLRELADAAGAKLLTPPEWLLRKLAPTVHPLGGAAMADSPDHGVTNPFGEVFGYPGLYIADGSLLPTPTGAPPSMTIAALAEHVMEHMLSQC